VESRLNGATIRGGHSVLSDASLSILGVGPTKNIGFLARELILPKSRTRTRATRTMTPSKLIKTAILLSCLAVLTGGLACNRRQKASAGGWTLENGQRGKLADYKGKVVLLDFYATWCDPCRVETPHLVALQKQYEAKGLQIIGANVGGDDDRTEVPAYAREFGIQYPLVFPDAQFVDDYMGVNQNIPQTFPLDRQGNVVKHFVGFNEDRASALEQIIQATLAEAQ
jgi:thiol-disulfide isomerase/thioredoxin